MEKINISVVIPCYNESNRINNCVRELSDFFLSHRDKFNYELIFVDDGSEDNTYEILHISRKVYPFIRIVTYNQNTGKGYAVRRGIEECNYHNILILDCDLSIKPHVLLRIQLLHNLNSERSFIVQGKRRYIVKQPLFRRISGSVFRGLVKFIFQMPFKDSQAPMKFIHNPKNHNFKILFLDLKENGFAYDVELLYACWKNKIMVHELLVDFYDNTDSRVTLKKAVKMFFELLRIRFSS